MALSPEEKISLLQYKLYFEELEVVNELFQKGQADFLAHVTNFRDSLSSNIEGQRESFNKHFFGDKDIEKNIDNLETINDNLKQQDQVSSSEKNENPDKWAKNLYRKIVFATHPDKTQNLSVPGLIKKFNKYITNCI